MVNALRASALVLWCSGALVLQVLKCCAARKCSNEKIAELPNYRIIELSNYHII